MLGAKTSPTGKRLDGIDMQSFFATSPETGEQYEFDNSVLAGGDWSGTFDNYDGAFTPEQIQKYYDIAMDMDWENEWYSTPDMKADKNRVGYKHISLGGSDTERVDYEIEQDWVKEIWDEINPGLKLIRHYLNGHGPHQSGGIHVDGWTGNQYTVIFFGKRKKKPGRHFGWPFWPNRQDRVGLNVTWWRDARIWVGAQGVDRMSRSDGSGGM